MNPWLDALIRLGLPTAFLGIVLRYLWPMVVSFIDDNRKKLVAAEKKIDAATEQLLASRKECQAETKMMTKEFMAAIDKREDTNRLHVKELAVLAETNRQLAETQNNFQTTLEELHQYTHTWVHTLRNHMTAVMLTADLPIKPKDPLE